MPPIMCRHQLAQLITLSSSVIAKGIFAQGELRQIVENYVKLESLS